MNVLKLVRVIGVVWLSLLAVNGDQSSSEETKQVLAQYNKAVGGIERIRQIKSRRLEAHLSAGLLKRSSKVITYWREPHFVYQKRSFMLTGQSEFGFDGKGYWSLSSRNGPSRKDAKSADLREELQVVGNPLLYVDSLSQYPNLRVSREGHKEDEIALHSESKGEIYDFVFDAKSHLLVRVEQLGVTASYYKRVFKFARYKEVDGIRFPFEMTFVAPDPERTTTHLKVTKLEQNVVVSHEIFEKPKKPNSHD